MLCLALHRQLSYTRSRKAKRDRKQPNYTADIGKRTGQLCIVIYLFVMLSLGPHKAHSHEKTATAQNITKVPIFTTQAMKEMLPDGCYVIPLENCSDIWQHALILKISFKLLFFNCFPRRKHTRNNNYPYTITAVEKTSGRIWNK